MALTEEQMKIIISEARQGFITVGGVCPNACVFCCLIGQRGSTGDKWSNSYYMSEEELDIVIPHVNELNIGWDEVFFGEGQYHLSCEPFKHPNYIGLLKRFHEKRPDLIKVVSTVGKYISDADIDELKKINIRLIISVNSFDPFTRKRMMKSKDEYMSLINLLVKAEPIIDKVQLLHGGDLNVLQNDINFLHSINQNYNMKPIKIGIPDYSRFHSKEAKELYDDAEKTWSEALILASSLHKKLQINVRNISTFPKELDDYSTTTIQFDNMFNRARATLEKRGIESQDAGYLLSESVFNYARSRFPEYENNFIYVPNIVHAGSYMVAGLLTKDDILPAVSNNKRKFSTYVLSRKIFNKEGFDLIGNSIEDFNFKNYLLI